MMTLRNSIKVNPPKICFLVVLIVIGLCACSTAQKKSVIVKNEKEVMNDFPTQARVEYVVECMNQSGGQSYQTMYPCVCAVDIIASKMSFEDFTEAQTFQRLRTVAGERGSVFRDPERSSELRDSLQQIEKLARTSCTVQSPK